MSALRFRLLDIGFNTQPPKGGWSCCSSSSVETGGFNTQPPKGGWLGTMPNRSSALSFNTQPPKGGWFECVAPRIMPRRFQHTAA